MIYFNLNPTIFRLGFLQIRYYGVAYLIGFAVLYYWLRHCSKKAYFKLDLKQVDDLVFYVILGVLIGGRIGEFLFYNPSVFWQDPLEIFKIWHGGMSFHGGLIGVILATLWFCKKEKISFYKVADMVVIPVGIALALGRIANFINGELIGTVTNLPWCIQYPGVVGCRHPSQLYEAIYSLLIFGILFPLRNKKWKEGTLFWLFVMLYGTFRFLENFFREDLRYLGLSTGQYLCVAMVCVSLVFLYRRVR